MESLTGDTGSCGQPWEIHLEKKRSARQLTKSRQQLVGTYRTIHDTPQPSTDKACNLASFLPGNWELNAKSR